jgi:hypothetical protein
MTDDVVRTAFLEAAAAWICEGYSLDVRYLAISDTEGRRIWDALITLGPIKAPRDVSLHIDTTGVLIGQFHRDGATKSELMDVLSRAVAGVIGPAENELTLRSDRALYFDSEMLNRDHWYSELHLQVVGGLIPSPSPAALAEIDNALRLSSPPFDGLADVAMWLELSAPGNIPRPTSITVRVRPPVDFILDSSALADDCLRMTFHAHPTFDVSSARLAVRAAPGDGLGSRRQVASEIVWGAMVDGRREGSAKISLQNADAALVMLMVGNSTVRRNWFLDPAKARNYRLLAIQHFDKDLRMVRQAVLESNESAKFETGVAALLFLLGFSPAVQLETDSPDLVVTTPGGQLGIVECTMRIADFASKLGKVVDRRGSLTKSLQASGHTPQIAAALVCRLPRDQISAHQSELRAHNVILITGEDLTAMLARVRFPNDPDRLVADALARMSANVE